MVKRSECGYCGGTGVRSVCGLCEEHIKHSNCDDTYTVPCTCIKDSNEAIKLDDWLKCSPRPLPNKFSV